MGDFRFDRMELAGSLADLGTMLPLLIPLVVINGLNATVALSMVGLFYVGAGIYYKIPVPVQPLKALTVIAITAGLSAQIIAASGLIMGILMLFLGATGLIVQIDRAFSKPVIRGVQVALGLILFVKAAQYIIGSKFFVSGESVSPTGIPLNIVFGLVGILIAAPLLTNKKIPAAIVLVIFGFLVGLDFKTPSFNFGPQTPSFQTPTIPELRTALILLVLPQIPLTISNSVISVSDLSKKYFGNEAAKATPRAFACSIGVANIAAGALGGMPMCHGAGGLAAHYRFGARTGGSSLIIGSVFIIMALIFGSSAVSILGLIPLSILGVMLAFTGIQMMLLVADIRERKDLLIVFVIAGLAMVTDMAIAFMMGIILYYILKWWFSWQKR